MSRTAQSSNISASLTNEQNLESPSHSNIMQGAVKQAFAEAVAKSALSKNVKDAFEVLEKIKLIENDDTRREEMERFYKSFDSYQNTLAQLLELDAKQQDALRRVRKAATNNIMGAYKKQEDCDQSFSLKAELERCAKNNIPPEELREYLQKQFRARVSLTGHPTNPESLAYTKLGYEFDEFFNSNPARKRVFSAEEFGELLGRMIKTEMSGDKKKPLEESEEIEIALRKIYTEEPEMRDEYQAIIDASSYAGKGIDMRSEEQFPSLVETCVWTHGGDADGNDNITAEVLKAGYKSLNDKGFNKTKVDIRHDSKDLMNAVSSFLDKMGIKDFAAKKPTAGMSPEEVASLAASEAKRQEKFLTELLSNSEGSQAFKFFAKKIKELYPIDDESLKTAGDKSTEIIKRLQVCAENAGKTDKLIIANTGGANHVLAAAFLLKITGNKVAQKGASVNIVTLSESIEDLEQLPKMQEDLMDNEFYREHLKAMDGRLIVMIAKSDTARVGGSGAISFQDQAAGKVMGLPKVAESKHGLDLKVEMFNGGGASLQRGGGRVGEVSNRLSRAAIYETAKTYAQEKGIPLTDEIIEQVTKTNAVEINPPHLTIQGAQNQSLFAGGGAKIFIEELQTQSLHAGLRVKGKFKGDKLPYAETEETRENFCQAAVDAYQEKYFENEYINEFLAFSNRAGVALGNLSSRPAKRGAGVSKVIAGQTTYNEVIGGEKDKVFDAFGLRAITFDRIGAHSGVFPGTILGLKEAFQKFSAEIMSDVDEKSKLFRDLARNEMITLFMVNMNHAWEMIAREPGQDAKIKARPNQQEVDRLAAIFENPEAMKAMSPADRLKATAAFFDNYIHDVAKEFYHVVSGHDAPANFKLEDLLNFYNKDLANEMKGRKKEGEFATLVEERKVNHLNHHPETVLNQNEVSILRHSYIASNFAVNSPISMCCTLTSRKKDRNPAKKESAAAAEEDRKEHHPVGKSSNEALEEVSFIRKVPLQTLPFPDFLPERIAAIPSSKPILKSKERSLQEMAAVSSL